MMISHPVWLFDLDNTLHHADAGIFRLINQHMTAYLAQQLALTPEAAGRLREDYWHRYGATLAGAFFAAKPPLARIAGRFGADGGRGGNFRPSERS